MSVTVVGVLALAVWYAWDRSARCFCVSFACAVLASTAEMALVAGGCYSYAYDALYGVAALLPCLAQGLWPPECWGSRWPHPESLGTVQGKASR